MNPSLRWFCHSAPQSPLAQSAFAFLPPSLGLKIKKDRKRKKEKKGNKKGNY
jgi:hypothetical protein